ncbi:MAG TPA: helix-turn-helix domain-containing protein [Leptospiraceae bacterium]|nr:helix-turn-helix domain-containing protein [Leptospiraceae bacterium]HRG74007.1 helix-turn-helix domain-containing protein [Leptospiraceae bacterium]
MGETSNQYIKFMSDIIDSGLWGKLSPAAKTLYPVLLKFSDQNFKHVWPSTETLLKLTGFKTKKSILLGKKELIKEGLLYYKPGCGRTNSTYYFSFNYAGSRITPQWDKNIPLSGIQTSPSAEYNSTPQRGQAISPNNLNITIHNNHSLKQEADPEKSFDNLMNLYGFDLVDSAIQIAKTKGLESNMSYVAGICKKLSSSPVKESPIFNQDIDSAQHIIDSWKSFLDWSKVHLTRSSVEILESIPIAVDGHSIFIEKKLTDFLKQIILKFFNEEIRPSIIIVFSETTRIPP